MMWRPRKTIRGRHMENLLEHEAPPNMRNILGGLEAIILFP